MAKYTVVIASALFITYQLPVHAGDLWSVGAGVLITPNLYKGEQHRIYPLPIVNYESENFYFHTLNSGYYLLNEDTNKLLVTTYYSPLHYRPKDSQDDAMRNLDSRNSTLMVGLSYVHNNQYGFLRTILAGDILDNSNGIIWDSAWLYHYKMDKLILTPGIGIGWNNKNQNKYYYGVSNKEALHTGLREYKPTNSFSPYIELALNYRVNKDWGVFGMGRYVYLSREIKDSPMVNNSATGVIITGVTYSF
ncbi:MipA/OmpV family protein [Providencia stuartii]|uniref:MipA/OmpV family protein n=1 Tax=Providencia stuartii TaxID=588 RepID=UPI00112205D9|nr:MipA/OmpV family protein [Providencia stuartii]